MISELQQTNRFAMIVRPVFATFNLLMGLVPFVVACSATQLVLKSNAADVFVTKTPNPLPLPASTLSVFEVVVYAEPSLAGVIHIWSVVSLTILVCLAISSAFFIAQRRPEGERSFPTRVFMWPLGALLLGMMAGAPWFWAALKLAS